MRRRLLAALVATLAVALLSIAPAAAHEQDPHILTFLDQVIPSIPGLDIQVRPSLVPELVVANHTPTELQVLNDSGRPFLRIGPAGTYADLATADWYLTNSPIGVADVPAFAQAAGAAPRWVQITAEPSWGWFDHRMHPVAIPEAPPQNSGVTEISRWIVPFRYGAQDLRVLGHLSYVSLRGQYRTDLVSPRTPFPGVTVDVLEGKLPGFLLSNDSGRPVTVLGRQGEPFARVGPAGIEANLRSATWDDQLQLEDNQSPTVAADPSAPPDWQVVQPGTRFAWLDTRASYPRLIPPPSIAGSRNPTVLLRWAIPLSEGASQARLQGRTSYVPLAQQSSGCTLIGGDSGCAAGEDGGWFPTRMLLTAALLALGAGIIAVTWLGIPGRLVRRRRG